MNTITLDLTYSDLAAFLPGENALPAGLTRQLFSILFQGLDNIMLDITKLTDAITSLKADEADEKVRVTADLAALKAQVAALPVDTAEVQAKIDALTVTVSGMDTDVKGVDASASAPVVPVDPAASSNPAEPVVATGTVATGTVVAEPTVPVLPVTTEPAKPVVTTEPAPAPTPSSTPAG